MLAILNHPIRQEKIHGFKGCDSQGLENKIIEGPRQDDDEEYTIAITLDFLITDSLIMEDEHLDTIPEMESDEFIKSSVENLVPNPSESEGISKDLSDTERRSEGNLFDESNLIESLLNQDSLIISSPKIDSLLEEFSGKLAHIVLISPGINEADFDPDEEIRLVEKLLYDNSSPRPPKEPNSKNFDAVIESFSPSPIPVEGSDSLREEIDIFLAPGDSIPSGIENDDYDSEGDIFFLEEFLSNDSFHLLIMSHFILMFHHPLVLLRNHRMIEWIAPSIADQNANQNGNGNVIATRAEGNANENNGNQITCYNCRGLGHYARNCTVRPRRRDAAYLQTELLMLKRKRHGSNFELMSKALVYDSDGTSEVPDSYNCYDNEIFNMFTQEERVEQCGGTIDQNPATAKGDENNALLKPVTSNSAPSTRESTVVKNDKVIASRMFRINPLKTSKEEKHVPNKPLRSSVRIKLITVSQPSVIHKKTVNSNSNGSSFIGVDNTAKTTRPQPRRKYKE
uniref:CCHC-type domain-containing protein n=1 Tax=Tanacetum cinerariifolium TaxID=118510 RepID=A0A6L2N1B7_TANCI|nr:hypothetical protein [Tanacetum cinerariifolium]